MPISRKALTGVATVLLVLASVAVVYSLVRARSHNLNPQTTTSQTGCVTKALSVGSTGNCVSDAQTMVNYIETAGLTECPFPGSGQLPIQGTYDTATQAQVKVVQTWINCYNKEEGITKTLPTDGNLDTATWPELCTYAYKYPKLANQSSSPYFQQSLAAGKDAGC